jgi:acetoin utilization protein AcuB
MKVGELMTTDVVNAAPQTSVLEAMDLMDTENIRHLPVVDGDRVVGIVSDRDLARFARRALAARRADNRMDERARVVDVMSGEPQCVAADDDVEELIASMLDSRIGAMPVIDPDGRLVGIVSVVDVLRAAVGRL